MSDEIEVPHPTVTRYMRVNVATEFAFLALIEEARRQGLQVAPVMGLMYLPSQELTRRFQQACRDILSELGA